MRAAQARAAPGLGAPPVPQRVESAVASLRAWRGRAAPAQRPVGRPRWTRGLRMPVAWARHARGILVPIRTLRRPAIRSGRKPPATCAAIVTRSTATIRRSVVARRRDAVRGSSVANRAVRWRARDRSVARRRRPSARPPTPCNTSLAVTRGVSSPASACPPPHALRRPRPRGAVAGATRSRACTKTARLPGAPKPPVRAAPGMSRP